MGDKHTKEIDKATAFDNFMNAEEAIAFGIVDEIKAADKIGMFCVDGDTGV